MYEKRGKNNNKDQGLDGQDDRTCSPWNASPVATVNPAGATVTKIKMEVATATASSQQQQPYVNPQLL